MIIPVHEAHEKTPADCEVQSAGAIVRPRGSSDKLSLSHPGKKANPNELRLYSKAVLAAVDFAAEYTRWGWRAVGKRNAAGKQTGFAIRRDEKEPSAQVNLITGRYKDRGGSGHDLGFFDAGVQFGNFATWEDCRDEMAKRYGVEMPSNAKREESFRVPWDSLADAAESLADEFVKSKSGITRETFDRVAPRLRVRVWDTGSSEHEDPVWTLPGFDSLDAAICNRSPAAYVMYKADCTKWYTGANAHDSQGSKPSIVFITPPADFAAAPRVHVCEGSTDAMAMLSHMPAGDAVVAVLGVHKFTPQLAQMFAGKDVLIYFDRDEAGVKGAAKVAAEIARHATSARVVDLPFPMARKDSDDPKDVRDFFARGGTFEQLQPAIEAAKAAEAGLPYVTLPGETARIVDAAQALGALMAQTGNFYVRGGVPMRSMMDPERGVILEPIKPASACSDFETVATLQKVRMTTEGPESKQAICPEQMARQILNAAAFREALPPVKVISHCPVLIERGDRLDVVTGYDRASGVWAMGEPPAELSIEDSKGLLLDAVSEFDFVTEGDKARALAGFITPALVLSGLLGGRAAIDFAEANISQSGKGYRMKMIHAIYLARVKVISQNDGGVGSMGESFNTALIKGASFILFDNMRGRINMPWLESFITENDYTARVPHLAAISIDPTRTIVGFTSNKAEMASIDLPNRSSMSAIRKQPDNYAFKVYGEKKNDILKHIEENQPRFLGAIFALIREWHRQGKPALPAGEVEHDLRRWAGVLGWIVQELLGVGPLTAGHRKIQERTATPALTWLRDVAMAVRSAGMFDQCLRSNDILRLVIDHDIETAGVSKDVDMDDHDAWKKATAATGRLLLKALDKKYSVLIDGMEIFREMDTSLNVNKYLFCLAGSLN